MKIDPAISQSIVKKTSRNKNNNNNNNNKQNNKLTGDETFDVNPPCDEMLSGGQRGGKNSGRGGWIHKYLVLFSRTWTLLFLASVVCSSLAQPHFLQTHDSGPEQFVQFPMNQASTNEKYHLNYSHANPRHLPLTHHVDFRFNKTHSAQKSNRRTKLRSIRRLRSGSNVSNKRYSSPSTSDLSSTAGQGRVSESWMRNFRKKRIVSYYADDSYPRTLHLLRTDSDPVEVISRRPNNFQQPDRSTFRAGSKGQVQSYYEYDVQNDDAQSGIDVDEEEETSRPCVYSGHLKTDRNWYGYLANISLAGGTGRLVFEFSYPAESCCLNILFYYEDQLSIMSARTNCWQKEDLLRPDVDQILRLTPSFSWSGCQVKRKSSGDTMVCKGGRSFTKHSYDFHPLASKEKPEADDKLKQRGRHSNIASNAAVWHIAVSNCASLRGLNLRYKFKVYGHSIPCGAEYGSEEDNSSGEESRLAAKNQKFAGKNSDDPNKKADAKLENTASASSSSSSSHSSASSSYQSHRPSDAAHTHLASDEWPVCTIEGSVNTTHSWFGFIKNLSLVNGGGFRFYFSLPYSMSPMNVLLYHEEDIRKLHWEQMCWLKESAIESQHVLERILDLTSRSIYNGCASKTGANIEGNNLTCRGEKIFSGDRNIYIALSNCRSRDGLLLRYKLEVFGYKDHTMCSGGPETRSSLRNLMVSFLLYVFLPFPKFFCRD